jgi:hypothetical protein
LNSLIEAENFDPTYRDAAFFGSTAGNFMKHAPWLNKVFQKLPDGFVAAIHPAMAAFVKQKRVSYGAFFPEIFPFAMVYGWCHIIDATLDIGFCGPEVVDGRNSMAPTKAVQRAAKCTNPWLQRIPKEYQINVL